MTQLKSHIFPNRDMLVLKSGDGYAGYHGLTVYVVSYLEEINDPHTDELCFNSRNSDTYMSESLALAGFAGRLASTDPLSSFEPDARVVHLALDTFSKYLGEGALRQVEIPNDWDVFTNNVKKMSFARSENHLYDGPGIWEALRQYENTSAENSSVLSDVMLEIPVWKLFELLTAITTLGMVLNQPADAVQKAA